MKGVCRWSPAPVISGCKYRAPYSITIRIVSSIWKVHIGSGSNIIEVNLGVRRGWRAQTSLMRTTTMIIGIMTITDNEDDENYTTNIIIAILMIVMMMMIMIMTMTTTKKTEVIDYTNTDRLD